MRSVVVVHLMWSGVLIAEAEEVTDPESNTLTESFHKMFGAEPSEELWCATPRYPWKEELVVSCGSLHHVVRRCNIHHRLGTYLSTY